MATINGDQSGYIIEFDAMGHALAARNWGLRQATDKLGDPRTLTPRPLPATERWELIDKDSDEVVAMSDETIGPLSMGALGKMLGEVLPADEFHEIVTIIPQ